MGLTFVAGGNFSGRSAHLRAWVGLPNDPAVEVTPTEHAFVGPDPVMALSGLTHSVSAEFELLARDPSGARIGLAALEEMGLEHVADQNPFTLSGGEQVVVAIVAAALAGPKRLAIDCALEQLAPDTRDCLLAWLRARDCDVTIADNRLEEWHHGPARHFVQPDNVPTIASELLEEMKPRPVAIEILDLKFKYPGGRKVFDGFSLEIQAGACLRLKGRNGSGKTTLSKLLCGLLKPQGGEIRVDGARVEPWRKPGSFVSYHFQNPSFQLFASTMRSQLRAASDPGIIARRFGLVEELSTHPLDLPYVMRKRLALATAFLRRLDFLIADEPTIGQDHEAASSVANLLRGFGGLRISHARLFDDLPTVSL
ncbi:MAG: energy-coupling factor transport system ATP-binding protein [Sphingomonadales bacterium]|jgi:energy-coupling factor transporter ATP-binding protein EcfA2|nr:energy-coupling factor transport system ATP-binding protein [Sphingomonadales bacterium]